MNHPLFFKGGRREMWREWDRKREGDEERRGRREKGTKREGDRSPFLMKITIAIAAPPPTGLEAGGTGRFPDVSHALFSVSPVPVPFLVSILFPIEVGQIDPDQYRGGDHALLIRGKLLWEHLDGDFTAQVRVLSTIHLAHTALADLF